MADGRHIGKYKNTALMQRLKHGGWRANACDHKLRLVAQ
jgi:hypothetical protein